MDSKFSPRISIIIPVYNTLDYLKPCLDSVVNQTYQNIEIICINDGSTDNSLEILKQYQNRDKRIKVVSKKNEGLSAARNTAHQYVTGKYMMYLDSDDWLDINTCEMAVSKAEDENADVVFWNYVREFDTISKPQTIYGTEEIIFEKDPSIQQVHRRFAGLYDEELKYPEKADSIVTAWGKLYRSDIVLEHNLHFVDTKEIGTEDALFNLYLFGYVQKAVYISDCLNHYRKNRSSLTATYKEHLHEQWRTLFGYMREYIDQNELDKSFHIALNNRICLSIIGLGFNTLLADQPARQKRNAIKRIISDAEYRKAARTLKLKYCPIHWRVFLWLAKHNCAAGVYYALLGMRSLKRKLDTKKK